MYIAYAGKLLGQRVTALILGGLLGLLAGAASLILLQSYSTSAFLVMEPVPDQAGIRAVSPERFFQTETQRILEDRVLTRAAADISEPTSVETLRKAISFQGGGASDVLEIRVQGKSAYESRQRMDALLRALNVVPPSEVKLQVLWEGSPSASLSRSQLIAGGGVGGVVLAGLIVLISGAVRRPILDPRYVFLNDNSVKVFPEILPARSRSDTSYVSALAWIESHVQHASADMVPVLNLGKGSETRSLNRLKDVIDDWDDRSPTLDLTSITGPADMNSRARLARSSSSEGRVLLLLGDVARTTEGMVEKVARLFQGTASEILFIVTSPKKNGPKT